MNINDFDYALPLELIAQHPADKRDASRLLVVHRDTGKTEHRCFHDILEYLNPGDCLVMNNSKVLPARLYGTKEETGAKVEFLLIKKKEAFTIGKRFAYVINGTIKSKCAFMSLLFFKRKITNNM